MTSTEYIIRSDELHDVVTTTYQECADCGKKTEPVVTTETVAHEFTSKTGYRNEHPHQAYHTCRYCGAEANIKDQYKTANGKVQSSETCCICHGHVWLTDEPQEVNGEWRVYCKNCGRYKEVDAPAVEEEIVCTVHKWSVKDESQLLVHPEHSVIEICEVCKAEKVTSFTLQVPCCDCGIHTADKNSITSANSHSHTSKQKCVVCKQTYYISNEDVPYEWSCIICNPNNFSWNAMNNSVSDPSLLPEEYESQIGTQDGEISYGKYYMEYKKTDEFKQEYLYAPNGGTWVSDREFMENGATSKLYASPMSTIRVNTYTYYAEYIPPEEAKILLWFMKDETRVCF